MVLFFSHHLFRKIPGCHPLTKTISPLVPIVLSVKIVTKPLSSFFPFPIYSVLIYPLSLLRTSFNLIFTNKLLTTLFCTSQCFEIVSKKKLIFCFGLTENCLLFSGFYSLTLHSSFLSLLPFILSSLLSRRRFRVSLP